MGAAQDVTAPQRGGNGLRLNRRGGGVLQFGQCGLQRRNQVEFCECLQRSSFFCGLVGASRGAKPAFELVCSSNRSSRVDGRFMGSICAAKPGLRAHRPRFKSRGWSVRWIAFSDSTDSYVVSMFADPFQSRASRAATTCCAVDRQSSSSGKLRTNKNVAEFSASWGRRGRLFQAVHKTDGGQQVRRGCRLRKSGAVNNPNLSVKPRSGGKRASQNEAALLICFRPIQTQPP